MADNFSEEIIDKEMANNNIEVLVLTPQEYISILQDKSKNNPRLEATLRSILANSAYGHYWNKSINPSLGQSWVAPSGFLANDAYLISKTLMALGIAGAKSYVKKTPKGDHIILTGRTGFRGAALQGTWYLASNPKMIKMGLGMKGLQGVAKGGFVLGLVVSAGIEVIDFIFNDEKTMYDLVGGIGVEAVKTGLAAAVAYGAATLVAGGTVIAVAPLAVMAVVIFGAGILINELDNHFLIKKKVIEALKATGDNVAQGIYDFKNRVEKNVNDKIDNTTRAIKNELQRSIDKKIDAAINRVQGKVFEFICPICRGKY
jgi:hypothetical protein